MGSQTVIERLRGLRFSASDLVALTKWPTAVIEDYLAIIDGLILIAEVLDDTVAKKLEEIDTDFLDGTIPVVDGGKLVSDVSNLSWDLVLKVLSVVGIVKTEGRRKKNVSPLSSPYNIQAGDEDVFCDTTLGDITVNLPAGTNGEQHKIINCGTGGNKAYVVPNGSELLYGLNTSEYLADSENIEIGYNTTHGWH